MSRMLVVNSSEIGMLAGYASFKPPLESAERFWKRNRPDGFKAYVEKYGPPEWYERETFVYKDPRARSIMTEKANVDTKNTADVNGVIESINKDARTETMTARQKEFLEKESKSRVFCRHGTIREDDTLATWCKEMGRSAVKDNKTYRLAIHEDVEIKGKIDGLTTDGEVELIEIKNRSGGKLFNEIRPYEMAQCQAYLAMLNLNKGYLIERMNDKMSHLPFERDESFWEECCERVLENIFGERFNVIRFYTSTS